MALHENDYDIAKTIDFFLEGGGDLSQDWKTAGLRTKKTNLSPNHNKTSHQIIIIFDREKKIEIKLNSRPIIIIIIN